MRYQGKITSWNDDQGFGFITKHSGVEQVFVHINACTNRKRRPTENQIVSYELKTDQKGRMRAENVAFVVGRLPATSSTQDRRSISLVWVILFVILVAASVFAGKLPTIVLGFYLSASIMAFAAYALDKSAAQNNHWRTPESTLHLLGLIGGWPGALLAQRFLRHKSKKQSFQITFWATVIINCGGLIWLHTVEGSVVLHSILNVKV
ncbi:DUF1294 domain-containing protein [Nitrosomonas supralitoralis]|uniref:DUF1294 domain-containing protein n=1 Tax=Nitrosomonas supralitoralis TaxID=2116706 RepID=A0A2P7NV93_9PROT|nr:cold shock and DUF1294 domain-containing protein [Nitrosomonas supralitoralis]PSJ17359.1 DUF1294 domain-containing protein [Nitrosomonas supralitoralis]